MSSEQTPRAVVERWVRDLLAELAARSVGKPVVRVAGAKDGLACLVLVWPADGRIPTARGEQVKPAGRRRERCREDILAVVRAAGKPLTYKEIVRALKDAGAKHGGSTVTKALADMTGSGQLLNTRDKKGYRLPASVRPHPTLFDRPASGRDGNVGCGVGAGRRGTPTGIPNGLTTGASSPIPGRCRVAAQSHEGPS